MYHKIEIASVEQSSTFIKTWPYRSIEAVDGDMGTSSHTICGRNVEHWFRMRFTGARCVKQVSIAQDYLDWFNKARMDHTKVVLINTLTQEEHLCGTIRLNGRDKTLVGAYHYINCSLHCGDMIQLTVMKTTEKEEGCIHIREIAVYMECPINYYRDEEGVCVPCSAGVYNIGAAHCSACPLADVGGTPCTTSTLPGICLAHCI